MSLCRSGLYLLGSGRNLHENRCGENLRQVKVKEVMTY
ncbi:hypothetical protein DSOL_2737 [Desulfosporosinus metallidurans]|uniref:Uncharacterized protein n=1 Tax=Desulfosporosinus metallidurans TaxID=1888891 RepID=A0A1Q8QVR5_9FIRM|nr:hypothetical protein DSOL_2737 [Desulfosporosinus metallidurans]